MKNKIQNLIKQGNNTKLEELLTNSSLELSKSDFDQLIGAAEIIDQSDIANFLKNIAKGLTKDEGTQYNSLNTTGDTDKENSENIKIKLMHNTDASKNSHFTQIEEWINVLKAIKDKDAYEHIIASIQEIYIKQLSYTDTVNEICKEVKGVQQNQLVFNALFNLSEAMAGLNKTINNNYKFSCENEEEIDVAGDVYDFTTKHIY